MTELGPSRAARASTRRAGTSGSAAAAASRISRTRLSSPRRSSRCGMRSSASARSPIRRSSRSCRRRPSTATATSSSTRSRRARTGVDLGFHRAGRWDEVIGIEECLLTTDLGNAIRLAVRDWAREERLEPYDQATGTGYLRHLVVREGRNTGQALVVLVTAPGERFEAGLLRRRPPAVSRGAVDPLGDQRHAGRADEPSDEAPLGRGGDRGGDPRAAVPRASVRVPADEHGDGGAAVRARARVRAAHR